MHTSDLSGCRRLLNLQSEICRAETNQGKGEQFVRNTIFVLVWLQWILSVSAASNVIGDANGDGKVNRADAQTILQKTVGAVLLGSSEAAVADINGDGQINALDAILVLKT